jgi:hypothetical protein
MLLSLIPAYNEQHTLRQIIDVAARASRSGRPPYFISRQSRFKPDIDAS